MVLKDVNKVMNESLEAINFELLGSDFIGGCLIRQKSYTQVEDFDEVNDHRQNYRYVHREEQKLSVSLSI